LADLALNNLTPLAPKQKKGLIYGKIKFPSGIKYEQCFSKSISKFLAYEKLPLLRTHFCLAFMLSMV
jgi:hypothetical protein